MADTGSVAHDFLPRIRRRQSLADNRLGFFQNAAQMVRALEALRINLVDILSPGRTRREPAAFGDYLQPANGRAVARSTGEGGLDFLPGQIRGPNLLRRESLQNHFLLWGSRCLDAVVNRLAKLAREFAVDLAGIAVHPRRDLRRQQSRDDSVFVRRPDTAIQAHERRTRALFAPEGKRAVEQAIDEPLEADRHLVELAAKLRGDTVNHLAAHQGLADRRILSPLRPVLEEVENGDRKVVIGWQQSRAPGDNPVPVVVGIAGEGDVEAILQAD